MRRFVELLKLRDPFWEGVGALVGALALIISTIVAYDIYRKSSPIDLTDLTVWKRYGYAPVWISDPVMLNRVKFTLDGEELKVLFTYNYIIENTGQSPILPDDFAEPLQVSIGDSWELLLIETGNANPPDLKVNWTRVNTNTFQLEPLLLNAGDNIEALIYLTHDTKKEDAPEPVWSGRIVNVQSFTKTPPERIQIGFSDYLTLNVIIEYSGISSVILVALFVLLFVGTISLGKCYGRISDSLPFITLTALFSLLTSNTIIRLIIETNTDFFFEWGIINSWTYHNWPPSLPLLGFHLLFLIYIFWPFIKSNLLWFQNSEKSQ